MKKVITEDVTNIPQGMTVGLTDEQAGIRAHLLEAAGEDFDLPEGFTAYVARRATQFKTGEVLFVPSGTQKSIVANLADVDAAGEVSEGEETEDDPDPENDEADQDEGGDDSDDADQDPVDEESDLDEDTQDDPDLETDEFDAMDRDQLKAWLTSQDIDFDGRAAEKALRDLAKEVAAGE